MSVTGDPNIANIKALKDSLVFISILSNKELVNPDSASWSFLYISYKLQLLSATYVHENPWNMRHDHFCTFIDILTLF